jgi:hypothetical protein
MTRTKHTLRLVLLGILTPLPALAQRTLVVGTGTSYTFYEIANRIITYMAAVITPFAVVMFIVGAFMITVSGVKEDYKQKGKDLMIGGVFSIAVVTGAYALLRTVDYFLS